MTSSPSPPMDPLPLRIVTKALAAVVLAACGLAAADSGANTQPAASSQPPPVPARLLTVTIMPGSDDPILVTLADGLAARLGEDRRFQVVDRTRMLGIIEESKLGDQAGRIISWDMLIRLTLAKASDKAATVCLTCIDLSRGNVQASVTSEVGNVEKILDAMAKASHKAADQQTGERRKALRFLGTGGSGPQARLAPLRAQLAEAVTDSVASHKNWELAQHIEAITAKEEALLLYSGMARMGASGSFMPLADATLEATVHEKNAAGKTFEQTPLTVGVRLSFRGQGEGDWVAVEGAAGQWQVMLKEVRERTRKLLDTRTGQAVAGVQASVRAQAEKAFLAARKSFGLPTTGTVHVTDHETWSRSRQDKVQKYTRDLAAVLKIDPTYEPAAYELMRGLSWLNADDPFQGRAALEAWRYIRRFGGEKTLTALRSAADCGPDARVFLYAPSAKGSRTFSYYAWPESPPLHRVLRELAELAMERTLRRGETNHAGELVMKALAAMREARVGHEELRVWTMRQRQLAEGIDRWFSNPAAGVDRNGLARTKLGVCCAAIEALLLHGDRFEALAVYRQARRDLQRYRRETGDSFGYVGLSIVLSDFGKELGQTDTAEMFRPFKPEPPFSWALPSECPSLRELPIAKARLVEQAAVPLAWGEGKLLAFRVREIKKPPAPRYQTELVVLPFSTDGSKIGPAVEITVSDEKNWRLGRPELPKAAVCGKSVVLGTMNGMLIGSLDRPVFRRFDVDDGLPGNTVLHVFAIDEHTVACFVRGPGSGNLALCHYDLATGKLKLIRHQTRDQRHPDIRTWKIARAWKVGDRWIGQTHPFFLLWEQPFRARPKRLDWPRPLWWHDRTNSPHRPRKDSREHHTTWILADHLYRLDGNGRPEIQLHLQGYRPPEENRFFAMFKGSPCGLGDIPRLAGSGKAPSPVAQAGDLVLFAGSGQALVYQASTDTWCGPVRIQGVSRRGKTIITPAGMVIQGNTTRTGPMACISLADIMAAADKAGLKMTTAQLHRRRRKLAKQAGPLAMARLAILQHDFQAARSAIDQALTADSDDMDAWALRALLNGPAMLDKPAQAADACRKLAAAPDRNIRYWALRALAMALEQRQEWAQARCVHDAIQDEYGLGVGSASRVRKLAKEKPDADAARKAGIPPATWREDKGQASAPMSDEARAALARKRYYMLEDMYLSGRLGHGIKAGWARFRQARRLLETQPNRLTDAQRATRATIHAVLDLNTPTSQIEWPLASENTPVNAKSAQPVGPIGATGQLSPAAQAVWRTISGDLDGMRESLRSGNGSLPYLRRVYATNLPVWREAARMGWAEGLLLMGRCHAEGLGVPKDPAKALEFYRQADRKGLALGKLLVAFCYVTGQGVRSDPSQAAHLWLQATEAGCDHAKLMLGIHYRTRHQHAEANKWFALAAEAGYASAHYELARSYQYGWAIRRDFAMARDFYLQGAAGGNTQALNNLAILYANGEGVPRDPVRAAALYRRCAAAGAALGMYNLADCYEKGNGLPRNEVLAGYWWRQASDLGDGQSMNRLGHMLLKRKNIADCERGLKWLKESIEAGCPTALGCIERHRREVEALRKEQSSSNVRSDTAGTGGP